MTELGSILTQLLKEIDEICVKNDIKYYGLGGTVIGQIRHGGLIPWDDDIDLCMPRKEYEKLEAIIDEYLPEGRELMSIGRFPTYSSPIARYTDLTTTAVRSGRSGDQTPCGECIEIFIMDPIPTDEEEQAIWRKKHFVYNEIICTGWLQGKRKLNRDCLDFDMFEQYLAEVKSKGRNAVLKELEDDIFTIDEADSYEYALRWAPRGFYKFPIHCFGTPRDAVYEGMHIWLPERAEEYLQVYIGWSWRNLLPPSAREGHATRINHSLHCGNCERESLQLMPADEVMSDLQKFKELSVPYYKLRNDSFIDTCKPFMKFVQCKIAKSFAELGEDKLKKDNDLVLSVFSDYLKQQRSGVLKTNNIMIPIENQYFDVLAKAMFEKNMIQQLLDLLNIKAANNAEFTELQTSLHNACAEFIKMQVHADLSEANEVEALYKKYSKIFPGHCWLYRCKTSVDWDSAEDESALQELKSFIEDGLNKYPEDDFLNKRYGDVLLRLGDQEAARNLYEKVADSTINGLLLKEMKEYGIEKAQLKLDAIIW